jgi:methionine biosynthesis protein MetW
MNSTSPDQHAKGFAAAAVDPLRYEGHTSDPDEAAGMIANLLPQNKRVLDVGCGTGSMSKLLVDLRGVQLVGIEPDLDRVRKAQARGLDVRHGILDDATAKDLGQFDAVVFADVLEHLPDPWTVLNLAQRVLAPDGVVIASVPNIAHWSVRWELLWGRFDYQSCGIMDATHLRWFTERSLRNLFESAGYRVDRLQQTAGTASSVYHEYLLWRWFRPRRWQRPLIHGLTKTFPRLFGYQHVVRAARKQ